MKDRLMGLEVEVQYLSRHAVKNLSGISVHAHDDGSIRSDTYTLGEFAIVPQRDRDGEPVLNIAMQAAQRFGLEVTTDPYTYSEMRTLVAPLLSSQFKHIPQTAGSSIHVHVDASNMSWRTIQRLIKWTYHLEAVLYRLACGGRIHRGEKLCSRRGDRNDYRYARPLSNSIGRVVNGDLRPLVEIDTLLKATSATSMIGAWGRLDFFWNNLPHYCPHRLMMINLASLARLGTIEWRLFDPMYDSIVEIVDLVAAMHILADKGVDPDFPPMLLGDDPKNFAQDVTCSWVSTVLDMDVSQIWGFRWPAGCEVKHRESHYSRMDFPSNDSLVPAVDNRGYRDEGNTDFCFVRRR